MTTYVRLYPRRTEATASLFRHFDDKGNKPVLRQELRDEACNRCGKIDEMKALRSFPKIIHFTAKDDFFGTWEHFPVVSQRLKEYLDATLPNCIDYFDVGDDFFVALPQRILVPETGSSSFRFLGLCPNCGRYSELLWGYEPFEVNCDADACVIHLENRIGITPIWIVGKELATSLKKVKPKLSGFVFDSMLSVPKFQG